MQEGGTMASPLTKEFQTASKAIVGRSTGPIARLAGDVIRWRRRVRGRRQLVTLDVHLLHDIGITQARAREEASKPFWRR